MDNPAAMPPNDLNSVYHFDSGGHSLGPDHSLNDGGFAELSQALTAAQTTSSLQDETWRLEYPLRDLSNNSTAVSSPITPGTPGTPGTPIPRPKLGSRFSRDVIRMLKNWLAIHQQHPYPTDEEMHVLQNQTGLNKAQLTNWFANARRRGKVQSIRPASPQVHSTSTNPVDIIPRPGTPAFRNASSSKNPMQRWVDSPPEHEPAAVQDIARAMASSSTKSAGDNAVHDFNYPYNDPWQSPYARSSASSAGTSHSSEFSAIHSSGSQSSLKLRRPTRRKRASRRRRIEKEPVTDPSMPYQCTFCTEVFKTKYDWQRHEKSLHLPLEQWVCALNGPRASRNGSAELSCVFCGEEGPNDAHIEAHHYSACQERNLEERTFHRKDHLVQHLKLVHNAKFAEWSMKQWMLPMPNIQSRCGFCGLTMSTWIERTDHLAEHFRLGMTMADWQGDWGFDDAIMNMVDSAVPPYFIHYERSTLVPMKASDPPWGSPPNAYELLKIEIEYFVQRYFDKNALLPTNDAMQLEACRIIFAAEAFADTQSLTDEVTPTVSWLRDLIMSSTELATKARFGPMRTSSESRHSPLKINAKDHLFEQCPLEAQLQAFVMGQQLFDAAIDDGQIQNEACEIVRRMETDSPTPSDVFANWLVKGIYSGTDWLRSFKHRAGVSDVVGGMNVTSDVESKLNWSIPRPDQSLPPLPSSNLNSTLSFPEPELLDNNYFSILPEENPMQPPPATYFNTQGPPKVHLPDDMNFFRCFESDIKRWVAATMSPKNPNSHIPSDEEIQHQARWIVYGGDDPWNQTPADYAEWLWLFKRRMGILNDAVDPSQENSGHSGQN